jgi:hypothetical protein
VEVVIVVFVHCLCHVTSQVPSETCRRLRTQVPMRLAGRLQRTAVPCKAYSKPSNYHSTRVIH